MKVAIITQPLLSNYGGILQNWALQQVLVDMGHSPVTIDYLYESPLKEYLLHLSKVMVLRLLKNSSLKMPTYYRMKRPIVFDKFVREHIKTTPIVHRYSSRSLKQGRIDAIIVGSDQVWRPCYNYYTLPDMFLGFAQDLPVRKVAYAASFGSDAWEYSPEQELMASRLIKSFNALSVRENSAVNLCREHFHIITEDVLDPTLLLCKESYEELSSAVPRKSERYLYAYILDINDEKKKLVERKAEQLGLPIEWASSGDDSTLSVERWIALFRDCEYVITDSYHGTVFSIIFEKSFLCLRNEERGNSRFDSLLEKSRDLDFWRAKSLDFLKRNLCPRSVL